MSEGLSQKMARIAYAVASGHYRFTIHGAQQRISRGIHGLEIEQAIASGEIIEGYPTHRHGPAGLILRKTAQSRALHILCSDRPFVDIITVYEPDPKEWAADLKTKRSVDREC